MRYTDFRRRFASMPPEAGDIDIGPVKVSSVTAYQVSFAVACLLMPLVFFRVFPQYDLYLFLLISLTLAVAAYSWKVNESALWDQVGSRYMTRGRDQYRFAFEQRRELWLTTHAINILRDEAVTKAGLTYLHAASKRASEFSQKQRTFIIGLLVVVAGWISVMFEVEIDAFIASMSIYAKLIVIYAFLTILAVWSGFFLRQRFTDINRKIENTLYDIIHLEEYTPPSAPKPIGPPSKAELSRGAGATSAHP